jgi:hypothetical protein
MQIIWHTQTQTHIHTHSKREKIEDMFLEVSIQGLLAAVWQRQNYVVLSSQGSSLKKTNLVTQYITPIHLKNNTYTVALFYALVR